MPKLKRSITATGLTLILVAGLAACGANNDDAASADTAPPAAASPSVSQAADTTDADAQASPSQASTSPSTSPSASGPYEPATSKHPARNVPEPGPLPEVAKEKSKAGQVAFVEHWVKEFNYGLETGKVRPEFWEMSSKTCDYCQALQDAVDYMQKDKSWNAGGDLSLNRVRPDLRSLENGIYEVRISITGSARKRYVPGKVDPVEQYPEVTLEHAFIKLRRVNELWQLEGLHQIAN